MKASGQKEDPMGKDDCKSKTRAPMKADSRKDVSMVKDEWSGRMAMCILVTWSTTCTKAMGS